MLSYQVREYYYFLNKKIIDFQPSLEIIFKFVKEYNDNNLQWSKKIIGTNFINTNSGKTFYGVLGGGIIENFKKMIKDFKNSFNFFDVFSKYTVLKNDINTYMKNNEILDSSVDIFLKEIDDFFQSYQSFMQSDNNIEKAIDFCEQARKFEISYKTLKLANESVERNMLSTVADDIIDEKMKPITIQLLGREYSVEEFTQKLDIINIIYCTIGNVIYKEDSYSTLKVIKIESGSLLSKILGDKNIIEAIGVLLSKSVNLVFNKFTYEGKIYRHTEFREQLLSDVEVTEKLKSLGYDVQDAEKCNKESLTLLTKNLLELSLSSHKIKIDETEYNMREDIKEKFLESNSVLKLSSGDEKDTPSN